MTQQNPNRKRMPHSISDILQALALLLLWRTNRLAMVCHVQCRQLYGLTRFKHGVTVFQILVCDL